MLNRTLKVIILLLIISIENTYCQSDKIIILSIKEALELSAINFTGTNTKFYEKELKSAYYNWIYYINQLKILEEKKTLFNDLIKIYKLKHKSGEISLVEKSVTESEYLKIEIQYKTAEYGLLISENDLKRILLIKDDLLPENDSLTRYELPPETIGKSVYDTLKICDNENYILYREFYNLKIRLALYDEQLLFYKEVLKNSQHTVSAIKLRYRNEDIEYSDYVDILNDALDFKLAYLNTLNLYNQTALKIESYFN
jgi:outer membrane protein TolC